MVACERTKFDPEELPDFGAVGHIEPSLPVDEVRQRRRSLIWSNSKASNEVLICRSLLTGRFPEILDMVAAFGSQAVMAQWDILREEMPEAAAKVAPGVHRILCNIFTGYVRSLTKN